MRDLRRLRALLILASVLSLLAAGAAFVVVERRLDREAAEQRAAVEAARRAAAEAEERRSREEEGADEEGGEIGGLLDSVLGALGGGEGGDTGVPGLSASVLTSCGEALADALPDTGPKLTPDSKEASLPAAEQLRLVASAVAELRGLRFETAPEPVFLPPEDFARRVQDQVAKEIDGAQLAAEGRVLVALGALPAGADLAALTRQALGSQVAGFYDPDTGDLVVKRSSDSQAGLDGQTRIILAHELDHALTDQALGLPEEDRRPGYEDVTLARLALVEGDATLVMQLFGLAHVSLLEQISGLSGAAVAAEELAKLPYHLQRSLTAPYFDGMAFACTQYAAGGWAALDKVYEELPTTSAQILFPERYRSREGAVDPRDPPAPGGSWHAAPRRALGAAELLWLLEAPGGDAGKGLDGAIQRAAAWAGGEVHQWTDGSRTATAVTLVQRGGDTGLCATVVEWYSAAFPGGRPGDKAAGEELTVDGERQDAVVRCAGADVRLGIAPDLATARTIAG